MTAEAHIARLRVVKKRAGQRVVVELDNGEKLELDPEIVVGHGLKAGMPIPAERVADLCREDECHRARRRLIGYLALRVKSIADARSYLEKAGFGDEAIHDAIDHAIERDFLNDRCFAERLVRTRLKTSTVGPLRLLADLLSHGIDTAMAEEVLRPQFDPEWQRREAEKLAAKQTAAKPDTGPKRRNKIFDMLQRRGFEAEIAREVAARSTRDR